MDASHGQNWSLPRSASLGDRRRISELFQTAKRRSGNRLTVFFDLRYVEAESAEFRLLVAIPRKIGSAYRRNRLRRILRETVRLWPGRFNLAGELIVRYNQTPKRPGTEINDDSDTLRRELIEILEWIRNDTKLH